MQKLLFTTLLTGLVLLHGIVRADVLQPYVLAWQGVAPLQTVVDNSKSSLQGVGFELIGHYQPKPDTHVLVVTAPLLRQMVVTERNAAYLAAQSVAIQRVGDKVSVSYRNPDFYRVAYRMKGDVGPLRQAFLASLGRTRLFGSDEGLTESRLARFQYGYGLEHFDDQMTLGEFEDHRTALQAIEKGFVRHNSLIDRVYRLDIPEVSVSIFGVAVLAGKGRDSHVHDLLDPPDLSHAAQLPYEVVVRNGKVRALHPRFRMALNFPDLKTLGRKGKLLLEAPDGIAAVLRALANGH